MSGVSQLVPLSAIPIDGAAQARVQIRQAVVRAYAKAMTGQLSEGGLRFPPVVLFTDGQRYMLADGFHRVLATRDATHPRASGTARAVGGLAAHPGDRRRGGFGTGPISGQLPILILF
jgi:hypothetical protein